MVIANLFSFSAPITKTSQPFDVTELLMSQNWQESAPLFLAENFADLEVSNVGSEQELGFSFQRELVSGFGDYQVNRDAPLDLTDLSAESLELLDENTKYELEPFCAINPEGKYCDLVIAWDEDVGQTASFIGVLIDDYRFALIERELLEKLS